MGAPVYKPAPVVHKPAIVHPAPAYKPAHPAPAYHEPAYDGPAVYQYGYAVADDYSGASFSQNENRDGYATSGEYRLLFPMVVPKLSNTPLGMPTLDTSLM